MQTHVTRDQALALVKKYNKQPFHLTHALTLEAVMGWFAQDMGYGGEAEFWSLAGLLHDVDFEAYPQEHCQKAPQLLARLTPSPSWSTPWCATATACALR